jgi:ATP-dependent helicase/nuclease subunit A
MPERHIIAAIQEERQRTDRLQREAADPTASAWVSANAGTGKTHVLTQRVLRILLAGTPPERILCLTYTKAAAAEMSKRVFQRLSQWVTPSGEDLQVSLTELLGRRPDNAELARARRLFTDAIETPGGLKVQTIHSFCERLLQRFPLEAGVPPHFVILDEESGRALQRQAVDDVLDQTARNEGSQLAMALRHAIAFAADVQFDELIRDALGKRAWLEAASRLGIGASDTFAGAEALYRKSLGVSPAAALRELESEINALVPEEQLVRARDVLATGTASDVETGLCVTAALRATGRRRIDALSRLFLTGKGEPRSRLVTNGLAAAYPEIREVLQRAQEHFVPLHAAHGHLSVVEASMALVRLADAVMQRYTALKERKAALDFDDLIRKTAHLLNDRASTEWVLYKLDSTLDHILVDEAQDTSQAQWSVIAALAGEFFSGSGARETVRTLFAVGDEKQSIYGFQGARPDMFAQVGEGFAAAARSASLPWRNVPLTLSFRTVAPVLAAIDGIFRDVSHLRGTTGGDQVRHVAHRVGQAGVFEVWDTEKPESAPAAEVWTPLDEERTTSPVSRLAARIADTIRGWLDRGERIGSENRAVRPGDILILVRKRRPFAESMVAALKARGIPVAGADRIELVEQLAVQDLMAAGDFTLLPEDDLVLAGLLKSPLCGLDDNDLLSIAPARRGSLWSALLAAAHGQPRFRDAAQMLKRWRGSADYVPPFEFFSGILDRDGGRRRLLARLGPEAADAIDELLNLALKYDQSSPPSLQGFLDWLRRANVVVKRDMDDGRGEVRVMTVHGAKGLEAPIVFLPDTCTTRSGERPGALLDLAAAVRPVGMPEPFCWPIKGSARLPRVLAARQAAQAREAQERSRLLYVALTRARDRLYVAGFEGTRGRDRGCWYDLITEALAGMLVAGQDAEGRPVYRIEVAQEAPHEKAAHEADAGADVRRPPEWAFRSARREVDLTLPLAPSRLAPMETDAEGDPVERSRQARALDDPPAPSLPADVRRFLRGTLTHALLQHLPTIERGARASAAQRFVDARGSALPLNTRSSIIQETLAILDDPTFAPLFGPDSRAEVPIVAEIAPPGGTGPRFRLAGQIDRLARVDNEVLIVDYKTNRPPPHDVEDVAEAYLLQLAAYRLAVQRVFEGLNVRAALLWTEGPRVMEVPPIRLDEAEKRLFTLDRAMLDAQESATYVPAHDSSGA